MLLLSETVNESKTALISSEGQRVTYGELRVDILHMRESIPERCLMVIVCDNSVATIRFYLAAVAADCVPLLLGTDLYEEYLKNYIHLYQPQFIWMSKSKRKDASNWGRLCYETEQHILIDTGIPKGPMYEELAILLTTSGSTGNPKTVRISNKNIRENTKAIINALQLEENAIGVTILPMNYTYGMAICNMHMIMGATLIVTDYKVMDPRFLELVRNENITNIQGVPFVHEMLNRLGFYDDIMDSINLVTMGGGRAKAELHEKMNRVFAGKKIRFCAVYGQTEGTTMLTKLPDGKMMNDTECIGTACLGMEAWTDPDTGELIFQGSSVCLGYAEKKEDLALGDVNHGILRTGDLADIDEKGKIYLRGRIRRFIKMAGIRVNLDDIENLVRKNIEGIECACCGSDDHMHVYVTQPNLSNTIKKLISGQIPVSGIMLSVRYIPEILHNSNGKIDYQKMETEYENSNGIA